MRVPDDWWPWLVRARPVESAERCFWARRSVVLSSVSHDAEWLLTVPVGFTRYAGLRGNLDSLERIGLVGGLVGLLMGSLVLRGGFLFVCLFYCGKPCNSGKNGIVKVGWHVSRSPCPASPPAGLTTAGCSGLSTRVLNTSKDGY